MHQASSTSLNQAPAQTLAAQLLGHLKVSILATILLAILVSGVYPILVWGLAQALFHDKANGSLIGKTGQPAARDEDAVGSALIGQTFSDARYFHPRPSAAGAGYDATASSASNLGPTSAKLINGSTKKDDKGREVVDVDGVHLRIVHYCLDNGIAFDSSIPIQQFQDAQGALDEVKLINAFNAGTPLIVTPSRPIPADAVTGSGSGLDPQIGAENAQLQAGRVAEARHAPLDKVRALITLYTEPRQLGLFGDPGVNVLLLNLALDRDLPVPATQSTTAPSAK